MRKIILLICLLVAPSTVLLANVITPEQYYNGDGDYTDAIQRCIDEAHNTGCKIEFSAKEYHIRGGVLLLKSNVYMFSKQNSRLYTDDQNNYRSIFFQDMSSHVDNVTIDGLFFDQTSEIASVKSEKVYYYVIQLYKASNINIKNCKFTHVGTNCICITGPDCTNTLIANNEFEFKRILNADHYDVSTIYVEDANHTICNNRIGNDGKEHNRQGGGIETHGAIGTISNNSINNCYNAINVVSFNGSNSCWNGQYKREIKKNTCDGCHNFVVFWPIANSQIKNVTITKNSANKLWSAVKVQPGTGLEGSISEVTITKNNFSGEYHEFYNITSGSEAGHLNKYEAVAIQNFGDVSMAITKNVFDGFPAIMVELNTYAKDVSTNVLFTKNKLFNCLSGTIKEPLTLQSKFALFNVMHNATLVATKNIIDIPTLDSSIAPIYVYGSHEGNISLQGNKFTGISLSIDKTSGHLLYNHTPSIQTSTYIAREHKKSVPSSLNKGDVIYVGKEKKTCVQQGTSKKDKLANGVLHGGSVMYLTCDNSKAIETGDWIVIKGTDVPQQARQVVAIIEDRIYLKDVNFALPLGKSAKLTKLEFFPYKLEDL